MGTRATAIPETRSVSEEEHAITGIPRLRFGLPLWHPTQVLNRDNALADDHHRFGELRQVPGAVTQVDRYDVAAGGKGTGKP